VGDPYSKRSFGVKDGEEKQRNNIEKQEWKEIN
jgi:hypothetical protein